MRIKSSFMRGLISNTLRMVLRKKLGGEIDVQFNAIDAEVIDGKTHIHLDLDLDLEKEELMKLLKKVGL